MDFSKYHNPYDFANPVSNEKLFVGRQDELDEIKYYLELAKTAPRPINIALLGPRASGKTSLLNMCDIEAQKRGFCTVRINLDESDAQTHMNFFYKLFDGILTRSVECGAYNGIMGQTYQTYLDMTNTYRIPEDKLFCPFLFPMQYARVMSINNSHAPVSEHIFQNDLVSISKEIQKPLILLFDECNVLARSRVHLEKIRNIFMNTSGYMLVFTGTPDLFPLMDEVFSPIVRQFKKINVGEFKNERETEELIKKPLQNIGIRVSDVLDYETYSDIREIHRVSSGKPYEIQLICHIMFRRLQSKRSKIMRLNLSILEEVRKELETAQDITARPVIGKIRLLNRYQLSMLKFLCSCNGVASFNQIWALEYILNGNSNWQREELYDAYTYLVQNGIIEIKHEIINFKGDDFDKVYTKYYAREQDVQIEFRKTTLDYYFMNNLRKFFVKCGLRRVSSIYTGTIDEIDNFIDAILNGDPDNKLGKECYVIPALYDAMTQNRKRDQVDLIYLEVNAPWLVLNQLFYPGIGSQHEEFINCISSCSKRADEVNIKLSVIIKKMKVIAPDWFLKKLGSCDDLNLIEDVIGVHADLMISEYLDKNIDECLYHVKLLEKISGSTDILGSSYLNNMGYFFMESADLKKAEEYLERALSKYDEVMEVEDRKFLILYNLGILHAKKGDFKKAIDNLNSLQDRKNYEVSCLFIPEIIDDQLTFIEVFNIDLYETARKSLSIITSIENNSPELNKVSTNLPSFIQ